MIVGASKTEGKYFSSEELYFTQVCVGDIQQ